MFAVILTKQFGGSPKDGKNLGVGGLLSLYLCPLAIVEIVINCKKKKRKKHRTVIKYVYFKLQSRNWKAVGQ